MRTLGEVLRYADPLGYEPVQSDHERQRTRQLVLEAQRLPGERWRRSIVRVAIVAMATAVVVVGMRSWPRGVADLVAAVRFDVHLAEEQPAPGLKAVRAGDRTIYLHEESLVTNADVADAQLTEREGAFSVAITLNQEGAAKLSRASEEHLGRPLAILIDDVVVMAPVIRAPMSTSALITGQFTRAEAERIVGGIRGR